ncbi:unnamed protein product [Closterium sp. Yama58-4]|nr:unnamed protein product [Closterium sp. Yama58-4]
MPSAMPYHMPYAMPKAMPCHRPHTMSHALHLLPSLPLPVVFMLYARSCTGIWLLTSLPPPSERPPGCMFAQPLSHTLTSFAVSVSARQLTPAKSSHTPFPSHLPFYCPSISRLSAHSPFLLPPFPPLLVHRLVCSRCLIPTLPLSPSSRPLNGFSGYLLIRPLSSLPSRRCWCVGSSIHSDALDAVQSFNATWRTELTVFSNDCRDYSQALASHLTGKKVDLSSYS